MWNYIYFALYLQYRDQNDHNALEKYIFESVSTSDMKLSCNSNYFKITFQMCDHEIDFFPQGKAKGITEE